MEPADILAMPLNQIAPLSLHPPVIAGVPTGEERTGFFAPMKKTFIHTFSNGDQCTLILDFTGEKGRADARWANPTMENRFDQIENEYIAWRSTVFSDFMDGMAFSKQVEVVSKLKK